MTTTWGKRTRRTVCNGLFGGAAGEQKRHCCQKEEERTSGGKKKGEELSSLLNTREGNHTALP